MPATGPKPKPPGHTVHRNPTHEFVEVQAIPFEGGPELPEREEGWSARTRRKWDVWRSMPHCRLWSAADWEFALDTIELVEQWVRKGGAGLATEIRNREKLLGTTLDYRRDLRIRYVDPRPEGEAADNVTRMDDYRDL